MSKIKRNILLNPGPATTTDTVKLAQVVPDICPREQEFGALMESICRDLVAIAGGREDQYAAVLFGGSGTAVVEAVLNSVVPENKKILIVNNGAYGNRMVQIAKAYGIQYLELTCQAHQLPRWEEAEELLQSEPDIACISMVHHETTTGLLNPIDRFGSLAREKGKLFVVDTISSFAGLPLEVEASGIDFMMSTSNKCLQGMAGVGFAICKKAELERIKSYTRRSFYLSLYDQYRYFEDHRQMRFTPPVQTLYALRQAIDEFLREGAANRHRRYRQNWRVLRKGVEELGFKLLIPEELESNLLITLFYPPDPKFDFQELHDRLYARGYTIYPGKIGYFNTFRLANMGAIEAEDIRSFLSCLEAVLGQMGILHLEE